MATVLKSFAISGIDGYVKLILEIDTIYGKPSVLNCSVWAILQLKKSLEKD